MRAARLHKVGDPMKIDQVLIPEPAIAPDRIDVFPKRQRRAD